MRPFINKNIIIAILLVLYTAFSGYIPEPDSCGCIAEETYGCGHIDMYKPQTGNSYENRGCFCTNIDYENSVPDIEFIIPGNPAVKTNAGYLISCLNTFNELTPSDNHNTGFTNPHENNQGMVSPVSIPLLI